MSTSSAARIAWRPIEVACESATSSWSEASISASTLMVSTGGPLRRSASIRSPLSGPTPLIWRLRVSVSGLYCKLITRRTAPVVGSSSTMPPFKSRGDPGNALMIRTGSRTYLFPVLAFIELVDGDAYAIDGLNRGRFAFAELVKERLPRGVIGADLGLG